MSVKLEDLNIGDKLEVIGAIDEWPSVEMGTILTVRRVTTDGVNIEELPMPFYIEIVDCTQ